jgi:hypothetical protein
MTQTNTSITHDIVEQILRAEAEDLQAAKLARALVCSPEFNDAAKKARVALRNSDCRSLGEVVHRLENAGFPVKVRAFDATTRYRREWKAEILLGFLRELLEAPARHLAAELLLEREPLEAALGTNLGIFGATQQCFASVSDKDGAEWVTEQVKVERNDLTSHCRAQIGRALSMITTCEPTAAAIDILTGVVLEIAGLTARTRSENPDDARRERVRRAVRRSQRGRHQK